MFRAVVIGVLFVFYSLLASSTAVAAGITIVDVSSSGASTSTLLPGDILTFDLVVDNNSQLDILGVGLGVSGHDLNADNIANDGLAFFGGAVASSIFNSTVIPGGPSVGGIANVLSAPNERGTSPPGSQGTISSGLVVDVIQAITLMPTNADGSLDIGVDGDLIANGDVHVRVQFQAMGVPSPTDFELDFGIWVLGGNALIGLGGVQLPFTNSTHSLTVVPEPGTAILLGVGLAFLGRRRA
ncbi:MAG: PEP-CTERM sorting domain-containing protein [Myxococcota bacterium]